MDYLMLLDVCPENEKMHDIIRRNIMFEEYCWKYGLEFYIRSEKQKQKNELLNVKITEQQVEIDKLNEQIKFLQR